MAGKLTEIIAGMKSLIETITTANGYEYDFGTINETDNVKRKEPSAEITYDEETAISEASALYGFAIANITIKLRWSTEKVEDEPFYAIDARLDSLLRDVKQVLLRSSTPNTLPIDDNECVIVYQGFTKELNENGDIFRPKSLLTRWTIKYQEYITEQSS